VIKSLSDRPCKVVTKAQDTQAWLTSDGCENAVAIFMECKHKAHWQQEELDHFMQSPDYRPQIHENKVQADLIIAYSDF